MIKNHSLILNTGKQSIHLQIPEDLSVRLALDIEGLRVRAACGGIGTCGACTIKTVKGNFTSLTLAEWQKIPPEEREHGTRLACQLYLKSDAEVFLDNPAPSSNWKSFNLQHWPNYHYPNFDVKNSFYAVAVDLGTTHIRLSFWDRNTQQRIACRHGNNPQVALGEDVLTRLDVHRQREANLQSLTQIVRDAIIEGIRDILARDIGEIKSILAKVGVVNIVGNTAMLALLSGQDGSELYDPESWEHPIACLADDVFSWKQSWQMPNANITIQAPLAGFIGSDILADLIAINITQHSKPILLADFGTNTEIALWDGKQLWLTSVPGGPAFEGVGLQNGLSAEAGAIRAVNLINDSFVLETVDDQTAKGFCASGFVDAIALLRIQGELKLSGRFLNPLPEGFLLDKTNAYTAIKPGDIDAFQRAKASTAAAMQQLLVLANISTHNLSELWICGAFGQHLNVHNAQTSGLIPTMDCSRIKLFGNAALSGCEKMILAPNAKKNTDELRQRIHVVNLSHYPEYDDYFINHLRLQPFIRDE